MLRIGLGRLDAVEGQRQAQVGLEIPLVELVEDDHRRAGQGRVSLQPPGEDAFGDDLDPGRVAGPAVVTGDVADRLADLLAEQIGHPASRGPRRQTARFEHDDLPVQPRLLEQSQRDDRGLARTGGATRTARLPDRERPRQVVDDTLRSAGQSGCSASTAPSRVPEPEAILVREDVDHLAGRDPPLGLLPPAAR